MYTNIDNDLNKNNLLKYLQSLSSSHKWSFLYGYGVYCSNCNCRFQLRSCEEIRMDEALK